MGYLTLNVEEFERLENENRLLKKKTEAYETALEIIVNIEKRTEQKPYGTVVYEPTLESVKRLAGQVLLNPKTAREVFSEMKSKAFKLRRSEINV